MKNMQSGFAGAWNRLITAKAVDDETVRLGRLFNTLMVISFGIVVALSADFLLLHPLGYTTATVSLIAAAFPLAFIPLSIFCLAQSRRGNIRPMIRLYVWVNLVAIGVAAWLFDGVYSPAWPLFIWTVTVAGTLLAPTYALWMTGGVVLYYEALLLASEWGLYVPLLTFGDAGREFVHMSALLIMLVSTVGLLTYLNMRSLRDALANLHKEIAERKRAVQAIEESERKFRTILEVAVDGVLLADVQAGKFINGNRAICDMLGYQTEELYRLGVEDIHPPEALPEVLRQFERQLKGEIHVAQNLPVKRKDGSIFLADVSAAPMDLGGRTLLVGIFHDVTERKQAEDLIRQANEELDAKVKARTKQLLEAQDELVRKEKLAVLGQVAGSVGHELRNPLGVMNNAVYYLQTVLSDADETVKEYLDIIKKEIAGSERIVSDLLDSVRIKPPQPETVGVAELIAQTLNKLVLPSSVTVKLDIPATLPPLRVDALQIHQVLRNLISNGVEAMPDGGTLEIRAVADAAANKVTVSVRDSGIGMTPEQLGKLFQPLFTTKARGIGLGLIVVKNLTQANGGAVEVQSEVGKGTTFSITLPGDRPVAETG